MNIDIYNLTESLEKDIWRDAIFTFDTSSLLNFYEYSDRTREDIFNSILKKLKNKLWLPFNVNFEYNKNKHKPIDNSIKLYGELNKNIKSIRDNFNEIKNRTVSQEKHPFVDIRILDDFSSKLESFKEAFEDEINAKIKTIESTKENDAVSLFLNENFNIGSPFSYTQIIEIIKEGEFRYRHSIPPGYKDEKDKIGFQKYGDLIIWKQVIEYAKIKKQPLILITDDLKEDWWILDKDRRPMKPREELISEMFDMANVQFWMYSTSKFIEASKIIISSEVTENTIEEVKKVSTSPSYILVNEIMLSANRGDEEPWRLERLENVLKFIRNNCGTIKIENLHDHKGQLTVSWLQEPTAFEKHITKLAWETENEWMDVEHIVNRKQLDKD